MTDEQHMAGAATLLEVAGTLYRAANVADQLVILHPDIPSIAHYAALRRKQADAHLAAAEALEDMPPADVFYLEDGKLGSQYSIPMILTCPSCGERHIDEAAFEKVAHHTHACQGCGMVWRPAKVNTHGVRFLPGYTNETN
jgi:predicted RNA-binding Zn-ribbon protein involved in translation (DUF1610 family)